MHASALAFSPEGTLLAAGDSEGKITAWNLKQDRELVKLQRRRYRIHGLVFARNPRWHAGENPAEESWILAAGDAGSEVTVWDLKTQLPVCICRGSRDDVYAVAFNSDGTLLASAGREFAVLWDATTGNRLLELHGRNWMTSVAFSPDGKRLAITSKGAFAMPGGVDVWQLEDGRGTRTLRGLTTRIARIAISPDDRLLAAMGYDWQIGIWDLATGQLLHLLDPPAGLSADNVALAFSPKGERFAFAAGTRATLWDLGRRKQLGAWPLPPGLSEQMAFDSTEKRLLLARVEGKDKLPVVRFYDLLGPEPAKPYHERTDYKLQAIVRAVSPDASYFALSGVTDATDGKRHVIKVVPGATPQKDLLSVEVRTPGVNSHPEVNLDRTGKFLAYSYHTMTLVEMPAGKPIRSFDSHVVSTVLGGRADLGPEARMWLAADAGLLRDPDRPPLVRLDIDGLRSSNALFTVTGSHVAWGNRDGTVFVHDLSQVQRQLAAFRLDR